MRWVDYVARIGEMNTIFWFENLKGRDHLEDPSVDGEIILQEIFGK
jgi:hypothetical protein